MREKEFVSAGLAEAEGDMTQQFFESNLTTILRAFSSVSVSMICNVSSSCQYDSFEFFGIGMATEHRACFIHDMHDVVRFFLVLFSASSSASERATCREKVTYVCREFTGEITKIRFDYLFRRRTGGAWFQGGGGKGFSFGGLAGWGRCDL